ncbi:MAG: GHMP kinase [Chloroflexota bacterium]|nr:MAG: GHMP kinase [Chloroflexota bacterium]
MIVVETPLRIGLIGGGTDIPSFYEKEPGYVLSAAIDKYVYVVLKERFDDLIYVNYSKKEIVESVDDLNHDLVREAMRATGLTKGIEVTTLADIPAEGTGLGSSSSILVALLHAMYALQGELRSKEELAREACHIEITILGRPIGKQDQYAAAYGDIRLFGFRADGGVTVDAINLDENTRRRVAQNLMLVYTNQQRSASAILARQGERRDENLTALRRLRDMALLARRELEAGNVDALGEMLHENWQIKQTLADGITNDRIDEMYETARRAGALGGKVTGAGGGGFLLLYCRPGDHEAVREALGHPRILNCAIDRAGTRVVFQTRR